MKEKSMAIQGKSQSPATEKKMKQNQKRKETNETSPTDWKGDGVDHINVNNDGLTEIGQMLSHRYEFPFVHSHFGRFKTLEGFEYYIRSLGKNDRFRTLHGERLAAYIKRVDMPELNIPNYRAIKVDALYQRIMQQPELKQMVAESTLPFDFYYVIRTSGLPVRPPFHLWMSKGLEEIRKAIKENREPDFTFLKTFKKKGIYDAILEIILKKEA